MVSQGRRSRRRGDSQFNLGILYARGIGVDRTSPNPSNGSASPRPRGCGRGAQTRRYREAADPQSLAAAKLAIQTFTPEPQPTTPSTWRARRRMGLNADAGWCGEARGQAGFDQANRLRALMPLAASLSYTHRQNRGRQPR